MEPLKPCDAAGMLSGMMDTLFNESPSIGAKDDKTDDGKAERDLQPCGLLRLDATLVCSFWPSERVVMGFRVCKKLREALSIGPGTVRLKRKGPAAKRIDCHGMRLFQHWNLELEIDKEGRHVLRQLSAMDVSSRLTKLQVGERLEELIKVSLVAPVLSNAVALKRLDLRNQRFTDHSAKMLSEALHHCTSLVHLDVGGSRLGDEGTKCMAAALPHCIMLEFANFASNRFGADGAKALMHGLGQCLVLRHLNISNNRIHGGWDVLGDFRGRALETVNFAGSKVGPALVSQLAAVLAGCSRLRALNLTNTEMGDTGAASVAAGVSRWPLLRKLSWGHNKLSLDACRHLDDALAAGAALTELNLYGNALGEHGARHLAQSLALRPGVRRLVLGCNELGEEGVQHLAPCLPACPALEHLDLYGNGLESAGMAIVAQAVEHCTSLQALNVGGNKLMGPRQWLPLLRSTSLRALSLCNNDIAAAYGGSELWRQHIPQCPALATLKLGSNVELNQQVASAVVLGLAQLSGFTHLDLSNTAVNNRGVKWVFSELILYASAPGGCALVSTLTHLDVTHPHGRRELQGPELQALQRLAPALRVTT